MVDMTHTESHYWSEQVIEIKKQISERCYSPYLNRSLEVAERNLKISEERYYGRN